MWSLCFQQQMHNHSLFSFTTSLKANAWSAILTRLSVSLSLFHLVFSVFISRMINKDFMSEFWLLELLIEIFVHAYMNNSFQNNTWPPVKLEYMIHSEKKKKKKKKTITVKLWIVINRIQNKSLCLLYVGEMFYVYINKHTHTVYVLKIHVYSYNFYYI